ncbi:hypothetical protein ACP4OV_001357 [Aristida adscensionis]
MASALLLSLLLCWYGCIAPTAAVHQEGTFAVVPTASIQSSSEPPCSYIKRLQLQAPTACSCHTHRHGPCAPVQTHGKPLLAETLRRDRARAEHITGRASRSWRLQQDDGVRIPAQLGFAGGSQQYVVTVGLGTPAVPQTLLVDTGSTVTWVQCKPCNATSSCYPQKEPLFDPSMSSTYTAIPCDSQACRTLAAGFDGCRTPFLRSTMLTVSVPGSIADTHITE